MKKVMFAAALAAGMVAFGDGVESGIVGYISQGNPALKSYVMVANSLQDPGSTTLDLNKVTTDATPCAYAARTSSAPTLKIWDPTAGNGAGNYSTFYYITDAYDEENDEEITAWANRNGDIISGISLPLGSALWYICQVEVNKNVTLAGEVSSDSDITVSASTPGYTMLSNPFPVAADLNKINWFAADGQTPLAPATYATRTTAAPTIKVWDPTAGNGAGNYITYYYINDAYDEENDEEITAWANRNGDFCEVSVAVGQGFWLILPAGHAGAKATFVNPVK